MRRLLPTTARLLAKLVGNSTVPEIASEIVELSPGVHRGQPEAIALPGEFGRVLAVQEETTLAEEILRLREGDRRHGPTVAFRLNDALLAAGTLYFGNGYQVIRGGSTRAILPRESDHFGEMQLCSNYVIERYFGHWLTDGLCLELLAEKRSMPGLAIARPPWLHERGYRDLCGLKVERSNNARVDKLWVIDDLGINDSWLARVEELRRRVQDKVKENGPKRVMLGRGSLGTKRNLVNSAEVHERLEGLGFKIIDPESETAEHIAAQLTGAEIVVLVEGSAQNHCWYALPRGATLVTIQPPRRFNAHGKGRADAIGIHWGYVVADDHPDGFLLPVERLLRTFDEVARIRGTRT